MSDTPLTDLVLQLQSDLAQIERLCDFQKRQYDAQVLECKRLRDEVAWLQSNLDDRRMLYNMLKADHDKWEAIARRLAGELAQCHAAGD